MHGFTVVICMYIFTSQAASNCTHFIENISEDFMSNVWGYYML